MVNHTAKAFEPKYKKETYRVVKVNGYQVDVRDYRGNISMVYITDVKKTLTDKVADDYIELCNEGRFTKKCVPRGYIPDLNLTTIHNDPNQPIKPVKQEEDPTETTVTPAAPTEVEGPPSSHLRSKTKAAINHRQAETPRMQSSIVEPTEMQSGQSGGWKHTSWHRGQEHPCAIDTDSPWSCQGNFRTALICHLEENQQKA